MSALSAAYNNESGLGFNHAEKNARCSATVATSTSGPTSVFSLLDIGGIPFEPYHEVYYPHYLVAVDGDQSPYPH
jgi:hypothetical protein